MLQQLTAASCSRLQSLTLGSNGSLQVLLLQNCKQLVNVHVSTTAAAPAAVAEAAAGTSNSGEQHAASSSQQRAGGGVGGGGCRGGSSGGGSSRRVATVLDTKGCVSLTAEGRARLVAAMAARNT